ncbi:MAG: hypothetical protein IPO92_22125 [Saprospiraceae bacterium]|nr:hypothetical protein [Saprospiraceae bacterium]
MDLHHIDSLLPAEMAFKAEQVGVTKANMTMSKTLVLAILAGAFIAFGAVFFITVTVVGLVYWFVYLRAAEIKG